MKNTGINAADNESHQYNVMVLDFEQLVHNHYQNLYRFALSMCRNPADASDLTQQTFVLWAEKGHQLRQPGKVKSWLFTTLYREFLRSRRRTDRFPHLELSEAETELPSISAKHIKGLESTEVMDALKQVDETFRIPLSMFYIGGHSYAEIAEIMDVPIGTVMSRISRGKQQMRAVLTGMMGVQSQEGKTVRIYEQRQG